MLRALQIFIVLFWLGSTSWLAWSVWAPSGSGFSEMETAEAVDAFFEWNETNSMAILENGRPIGQVTVTGSAGPDRRTGRDMINGLSTTGSLNGNAVGAEDPDSIAVSWRVSLEFDDADPMNLLGFDLTIRIPEQKATIIAKYASDDGKLRIRATMRDRIVFEYAGAPGETPEIPEFLKSGFTGSLLGDFEDPEMLKPEFTAKRGMMAFDGPELPVFLLEVKMMPEQQPMKIFLSQTGEPLKIETGLGIEAISDVLVPLEAFK